MQGVTCRAEKRSDDDFLGMPLNKSDELTAALTQQVEKVMGTLMLPKVKKGGISSFTTCERLMELQVDSPVMTPVTEDKVVGLAWQNDGSWEFCTLLDIAPVWRTKGRKEGNGDYPLVTPAEQPFLKAHWAAPETLSWAARPKTDQIAGKICEDQSRGRV